MQVFEGGAGKEFRLIYNHLQHRRFAKTYIVSMNIETNESLQGILKWKLDSTLEGNGWNPCGSTDDGLYVRPDDVLWNSNCTHITKSGNVREDKISSEAAHASFNFSSESTMKTRLRALKIK